MYCGQMAGWIKMPFGTEVSPGLGHIVLDGDPQKTGTAAHLHFLVLVYCGQTAGWIRTPLDTGYIVLDGDSALF